MITLVPPFGLRVRRLSRSTIAKKLQELLHWLGFVSSAFPFYQQNNWLSNPSPEQSETMELALNLWLQVQLRVPQIA